jgi:Membrane bound FAD containing D-sorbitol dehydrogenase
MTDLTRRKMLSAAAATAAGAVTSANLATPAAADDAADTKLFVTLSAALTGIAEGKLAPPVDPIQVKNDYFKQAKLDPAFPDLIKIMRDNPSNPAAAADSVMNNANPAIKFLGRSIILAWYLGTWYEPKMLAAKNAPVPGVPPPKVISPKAYTQGWTWRVAQTHPMGYSELRFGYWSDEPPPLDVYIK